MIDALVTVASVALPALRSDVRHKQEILHAQHLHSAEATHARQLLDDRLTHKADIYSTENVLAMRRHALGMEVARSMERREALRDAWQQRTMFLQTMLLTVSLMLSTLFVALTQGRVADIAREQFRTAVGVIDSSSSSSLYVSLSQVFGTHLWMGSMGVSIACLFTALWLCLLVQRRIGRYRVLPSLADAGSHGAAVAKAALPKSVAGGHGNAGPRQQHDHHDDDVLSPGGGGGVLSSDSGSPHRGADFDDLGSLPSPAAPNQQRPSQQHQPLFAAGGGDDEDVFSVARGAGGSGSPARRQAHHNFDGGADEPEDYASAAAAGAAIVDDASVDDELRSVVANFVVTAADGGGTGEATTLVADASAVAMATATNNNNGDDEDDDAFSPQMAKQFQRGFVASSSVGSPLDPSSPTLTLPQQQQSSPSGSPSLPIVTSKSKSSNGHKKGKRQVVRLRDLDAQEIMRHLQNRGPTALANDDGRGDGGADKKDDEGERNRDDEDKKKTQQKQQQQKRVVEEEVFRYSCGKTHEGFNSYYECHCEPLRRAAGLLLATGTVSAVVAAAALHAMLMQDVFRHASSAFFVLALTGVVVIVGLLASKFFSSDDLVVDSVDSAADFMGLAAAPAASAPF